MKRFFVICVLLLSTSTYGMNHAHIDAQSIEAFEERSTRDTSYSRYFSPLFRLLNEDFASNLRFVVSHDQWNPRFHSYFQTTEDSSFSKDAMTQLVHLLFPSAMGNYLTVNQTLDAGMHTNAQRFYETLMSLKQGGVADVWAVFLSLFQRELSPSAKDLITREINAYSISEFGKTARLKHLRHGSAENILEKLIQSDVLDESFLACEEGGVLRQALAGNDSWWGEIHEQADSEAITQNDFYGYLIAHAFSNAFLQEGAGEYAPGTLDRVIAAYVWKKGERIDDVRFLFPEHISPSETDLESIKVRIRPLIENPALLPQFYSEKRYDDIWAYIYRDRLMLDDQNVPLVKSRMTTVHGRPIPDYVETAIRNMTNFFCFKDGAFDPTFWKEGSVIYDYYTKFQHTSPHDPLSREVWAQSLANLPRIHYYSPSKEFSDTENTEEMVPGVFNVLRVLAHIGGASKKTKERIEYIRSIEHVKDNQLATVFQMLMDDLTGYRLVFDYIECAGAARNTYNDPTYQFNFPITGGEQHTFDFRIIDPLRKYDTPKKQKRQSIASHLSDLDLFRDLKSHYADINRIVDGTQEPEMVARVLMESDLQSSDLRYESMEGLLIHNRDLPLLKSIFNRIERDRSIYEESMISKKFRSYLDATCFIRLDSPEIRCVLIDLINSAPRIFIKDYENFNEALYRQLIEKTGERDFKLLAIDLMKRVKDLKIRSYQDPILPHIAHFRNLEVLQCAPLVDGIGQLLDLSRFKKLNKVSLYMSEYNGAYAGTLQLSPEQISDFVQSIPTAVERISFHNINNMDGLLNVFNIATQMRERGQNIEVSLCDPDCLRRIKRVELEQNNGALFEWVAPYLS